jgi:PAS domain S-box-containing protein
MSAVDWFLYGAVFDRRASPAEVFWTFLALLGLLTNVMALIDAQGDLYLLRTRMLNGARELVARGHRRNAVVRGGVKLGLSLIGLAAMNTPPPPNRPTTLPVLVFVFLLAIGGMSWADLRERTDRRTLLRLMSQRHGALDVERDGVVVIDRDSNIISASRGAWFIFGYGPEELEGLTLASLLAPDDYEHHRTLMAVYLATGENGMLGRPRHIVGIRKDGVLMPIEATFVESGYGETRHWTVILRRPGPDLVDA